MNKPDIAAAARAARTAALQLASLDGSVKNEALKSIGTALTANAEEIFAANGKDLDAAAKTGVAGPLLKRLVFDEKKLAGVLSGIESLIRLPEPVGKVQLARELDEGLTLYRVSCPIGVIGMIFESRPDALVQIATLCLKSGNAVLLKGGREASETNRVLAGIIEQAAQAAGIPDGWIVNLETRDEVRALFEMDEEIDLLIPRGSNEFVRYIMENSRIPVMGHADGVCHTYIHTSADPELAVSIAVDGKTQYPAVCNATETILIDRGIAAQLLPPLVRALQAAGVEVRGCDESRVIFPAMEKAEEEDWSAEYLDLIVALKVVDSREEAVAHINRYGSGHTDAIVAREKSAQEAFVNGVDSANLFVNCSTRFADGYRYGFGAEVGISTGKLHARGPVGLEGLLTYKYTLYGEGHLVADYAAGKRVFTHRTLRED